MKIAKSEDQAVRLVVRLARHGGRMTVAELADSERLTEPTAAKLLGRLRRGGVVRAVRGCRGGYVLARPPEEIAVGEILAAVGDRLLRGGACTPARPSDRDCPHLADCGLRPVWQYVERELARLLAAMSLADLLRSEREVRAELAGRAPLVPFPLGEGVVES